MQDSAAIGMDGIFAVKQLGCCQNCFQIQFQDNTLGLDILIGIFYQYKGVCSQQDLNLRPAD